ncbi:hypothetical protein [Halorientalis salina]|uniref:hypothetical protein n=1 Tax=Halorientalis salina TaxID=2932266 RepID=UPI0010AD8C48|nr:hypothetical protein [Halorientalis salina]
MDSATGAWLRFRHHFVVPRAVELFTTYDGLVFDDATLVAYIEREGIEHLCSFDDDFDAIENITRLESADNPYNQSTCLVFGSVAGTA